MKSLDRFFHSEASGGIVLLACACFAMAVANSPFADYYGRFLSQILTIGFTASDGGAQFALQKPLLIWINDFFMAIFFLYAGLEIKREVLAGALNSPRKALLPAIAAGYGMMVPAVIFVLCVLGKTDLYAGWAIPAATDIAFALGVLALAAPRVPPTLKALLMAVAVIDDLGAILVIALFYTSTISLVALGVALFCTVLLVGLNRLKVSAYGPYLLIGLVLWAALLNSGLHPTLGGVIVGLCIPMRDEDKTFSPVEKLISIIHPWVVFAILPLFGFANAGVSFAGFQASDFFHPVVLGITFGLFVGKQMGIMGAVWLAVRANICKLPEGVSWRHLYGMALLCGIGFTMALFIGGLAFEEPAMQVYVRLGVILGSVLSALAGFLVLHLGPQVVAVPQPEAQAEDAEEDGPKHRPDLEPEPPLKPRKPIRH